MPVAFTPESPLGLKIQQLLIQNQAGLTVAEIRHSLRRTSQVIEERNLRELLNHPKIFTALPGDKYCLTSRVNSNQNSKQLKPTTRKSYAQLPMLLNICQAMQDFVVIDLETTGLEPKRDKIFQLAAIGYQKGRPTQIYHQYYNPEPAKISYSLQVKLGIANNPKIAQLILDGPSFSDKLVELKAFIGNLPLVAHNARFEQKFLQREIGEMPNLFVDTLELSTLFCPELPNHTLEDVATQLGANYQHANNIWELASGDVAPVAFSAETLHNAITDTALLAATYERLLIEVKNPSGRFYTINRGLLPEMYREEWKGESSGISENFTSQLQPVVKSDDTPQILPLKNSAAQVESLLDSYLAARNFPKRAGQANMVRHVWEALDQDHFKLIEAPTGTGKTIACLIPSLVKAGCTGQQVAFSTAYRNLQDQLLGEIEELKSLTEIPFHYQLLKGVSNYFCNDRLLHYLEELDEEAGADERFVLAYLLNSIIAAPATTQDDLSYWLNKEFKVASHIYQEVSAANSGCSSSRCQSLGCALPQAAELAKAAHLLVINHDLWLAKPERLPHFSRLVLDEAHNLEDIATRAFTKEVSRASLQELFNRLEDSYTGHGAFPRILAQATDQNIIGPTRRALGSLHLCQSLITDFGTHLAAYLKIFAGKLDPRYGAALRLEVDPRIAQPVQWSAVEQARKQLFDLHLNELIGALNDLIKAISSQDTFQNIQNQLFQTFEQLLEQQQLHYEIVRANNLKSVYWIEVGEPNMNEQGKVQEYGAWALKTAPIRVDTALQEYYQELDSVVLMSATLTLRGGEFDFFVDRLGLGEWVGSDDLHMVTGDLDYSSNAFLGLANYLEYSPVERTMKSFVEEFSKELQLLLDFTNGRTLVLFTARERMELAVQRCEEKLAELGIPLFWQQPDSSRRKLQEDFQARIESVLMGLQSFWEGVDVPGESLSFVIMEKLPFPFLFEPVFRARREEVMERGKHEFNDYIFPLMAIKFKQGFGRLLRRKDDRGAVILLDKRIHRKTYKQELLASLPGYIPRHEEIERSRHAFYQAIAESFPNLIDIATKQSLLNGLPTELALDFTERLKAYSLPNQIAPDKYLEYRPQILRALKEIFGFDNFRSEEQEDAIRGILTGQDVLALLPTGAGKSLCFQLSALLRSGLTVVFSPLIALMRDQVQSLTGRGIEIVGAIYSGQAADEREELFQRMRSGKLKLVYISPERLRDPQLLQALLNSEVRQVVVDEAHCVALWGPSFRPDFLYLPRLFEQLDYRPPLAAFTATATLPIRQEIKTALKMHDVLEVVASFNRPELRFVVYNERSKYNRIASKNKRFNVLMKILQAADYERDSVLVYVATTVEAEMLSRRLRQAGYDARAYHGKMASTERDSVQELFMDDHVNIVVCTKAFGMGIDKPDIRYVIHYNTPGDLESYYQEAGRAGRDGNISYCILLSHRGDQDVHDFFIESAIPDPTILNEILNHLRALPGEKIYFSPETLLTSAEIEEVQLKVGLHLLEEAGFIGRGADFTQLGSLTLLSDLETIGTMLEPENARKFATLASLTNWLAYQRTEVDLIKLSELSGFTPETIEDVLIQLAIHNLALYRPWEKGFLLYKKPRLVTGEVYSREDSRQEIILRQKLESMFRYAQGSNKEVQCRRAYILNYLGETSEVNNCGTCDICNPEYTFPWSQLTAREVGEFADIFDPAFSLLEVVKWAGEKARQNPYSAATLLKILRGNSHQLGKYITDPALRRRRLQHYRSCPYWGLLESLPKAEEILEKTVNKLLEEEYLTEASAVFAAADGSKTYRYFDLLPRGRDQLLRGELLRWKWN